VDAPTLRKAFFLCCSLQKALEKKRVGHICDVHYTMWGVMSTFTTHLRNRPYLLGGVALAAVLAAFFLTHDSSGASAGPAAPPPVPVVARTIAPRDVRIWSSFSGRMQAVDAADIRPEVTGRVTEIRFRDGQMVRAGDVLFVIDPRSYEANAAKARGDLAAANASAALAKTEFERGESLLKAQAIAKSAYDQRANAAHVAQANVQVAQAALRQAALDVEHAYVRAPISGRISRAEITVGNLVTAGPTAPLLASIVSTDGIYADFEVDEPTYLKLARARAAAPTGEKTIPVELTLQGDSGAAYKGVIDSFDNKINTGSGTIRARARFDNKDGALISGMFVTVKLGSQIDRNALLVPEGAIGTDQNKRFVYVVDAASKAAFREVVLGPGVDGEREVLSGLRAGDRVIVDGLQHIMAGSAVQASTQVAAAAPRAASR
jgi:multidrug efflux system membrane fusion protein